MTSASLDLYRDLRDAAVENTFFRTYGPASIGMVAEDKEAVAEEPVDARDAPLVKEALSHIEDGDRTKAIVRTALLLMKAGTGRRRLSAMKRARELVGKDIGLLDMPAEAAREIIHEQSYIVDFEPVKALAALPKLLRTSEDRRRLLDLLDRLEGQIEANAKQITLLGEIRRLLSGDEADGDAKGRPITVTQAETRPRTAPRRWRGRVPPVDPATPDARGQDHERSTHRTPQSRPSIEDSARQAGPRHRHRQRAFDRLWLRPGLPPARGRPRRDLPEREGPALCRATRQGTRGLDLRALRRGPERRARSGLPADPRDLGQPRHRAPFHRLRAEGGSAGAAPRQLGRGVQGGDGHLLPFLHPHGAARRAA